MSVTSRRAVKVTAGVGSVINQEFSVVGSGQVTHQVFPEVSKGPVTVAAGEQSPVLPFPELAGGGAGTLRMYLQVTKLGHDCSAPSPTVPEIGLSADGGPVTEVTAFPNFSAIHNGQDDYVADASLSDQGDGVYLVHVFVTETSAMWGLVITNLDDTQQRFTWVVADVKAEAAQPWLNLPTALSFTADPGGAITKTVEVRNLGSAKLAIAPGGLPAASRFEVTVPPSIGPNRCGKLTVTFRAPPMPGTTQEDYTAQTNDQLAAPSTQHNNRIRLTGITIQSDPGSPPEALPCHACNKCPDWKGPVGSIDDKCKRPECRHSRESHQPK